MTLFNFESEDFEQQFYNFAFPQPSRRRKIFQIIVYNSSNRDKKRAHENVDPSSVDKFIDSSVEIIYNV